MKNIIKTVLILSISGSLTYAMSAKWLDDGNVVNTTPNKVVSKSLTSSSNEVTLATGERVTISGGVYVKSSDPDAVVLWAQQSGYEVRKDKYTQGAVHITVPASESIEVANSVAKLEGVTTAAPKYRRNLVSK